ncbi:hypothetical protein ACP70R_039501 [Stipagrostis hirtigluma subsp. patula]
MAAVQDLPLQLPRRDAPYHFVALIGASVVVLSVAGEPLVHPGYALAGVLLWLIGAARMLQSGQMGALAAAAANLACRAEPYHLTMLIGAAVVVLSVVGEPSVHAGYALAGFLLWLLGASRLLLFGQLGAPAVAAASLARRATPYHHLLMLIGAPAVVFSVACEPSVHAGYALAGFLLWLLGAARLLPLAQFGAPAAAAANLARRAAPYHHLLMLIGASAVVFSVAGEPPVLAGCALARFLLWLLGAARLLLSGQMGARAAAAAAAAANLGRRAAPCPHLPMLIGASALVFSVVGEPPVHAGYVFAAYLLWLLGVAKLLFSRKLHALSPGALAAAAADVAMEKLKHFIFCRGD